MCGRLSRPLFSFATIFLAFGVSPAAAQLPEVNDLAFLDSTQIVWDPLPATAGYHIYRGALSGLKGGDYGACLYGSVQGTSAYEYADPPLGQGFFYLAGGYDETGPGTLGNASTGPPRTPAPLCIGSRRYVDLTPDVAPDGLPSREPLRNPAIEEWVGTREWTGVVLHSGEFALMVRDPIGGYPGHAGTEPSMSGGVAGGGPAPLPAVNLIASGGAKFLPGKPISAQSGGGGGGGGAISFDVGDEIGVGSAIAINVVTSSTEAQVGDSSTVSGGDETPSPAPGKQEGKEKKETHGVGVGSAIAINVVTSSTEAQVGDSSTVSGGDEKLNPTPGRREANEKRESSEQEDKRVQGVERHYRSRIAYDGPLGHGWDFTANSRLEPDGTDVTWYDGTGRRFLFHRIGPSDFVSPMGCYAKLVEQPGSFHMRFPDGTIRTYHGFDGTNLQGALSEEHTLDGRVTSFLYDNQGLLTQMTDDLGRVTTLDYNPEGRISAATDFAGRSVEYGYDLEGNLVSVRSPIVTGTPNGNDFPLGKTTAYGYTAGHPDDRYNHNLVSIVSPRESGSGTPFIENDYEADPNLFAFDRVTEQRIGGLGSGGIPAGGAITYGYVPLNPGGDPLDMALPRREVTVVDRNGNERVWLVNAAGNALQFTERTNRGLRPGEPDYVTQGAYNPDGEVVNLALPQGNEIVLTYDRPGADRYREGDVLEVRLVPDQPVAGGRGDGHGGSLGDIAWSYTYDPVGRRLSSVTDPMGRQAAWTYDYQEGDPNATGLATMASAFGLDISGVSFNLGDLNGDGLTDQTAGRPVLVDLPTVGLRPGSHQAGIEGDLLQEIRYTPVWNSHGQLTSVRDPEGNLHLLEYFPEEDPDGDGTPTPAPPDGRILDAVTGGYLKSAHQDVLSAPGRDNGTNPTPANIQWDYEYDPVGNLVSLVDGRGVRTSWTHNQLDQVVEHRRASATATSSGPHGDPATGRGEAGLAPLGYRVWFFYDEDDNLAQRHVEEAGGLTGAGPWIETRWTYDILDNVTSHGQEAAPGTFLTTEYRYDANENLTLRTHPEGNSDEWLHDERDLLLSATRGAAGPGGGTPTTRRCDYDGNGNLTRLTDGRGGLIDYEHDGADRVTRVVGRLGSTSGYWYDPAGNVVHEVRRGPVGGPAPPDRSGSTNVDLAVSDYSYDELNRLVQAESALQVVSGAPPVRTPILQEGPLEPGDGEVDHIYEYDRLSRLTFDLRDSGATTRFDYDGAGRLLGLSDPADTSREWTWDGNGNPVELVELESSSVAGPLPEEFLTTFFYDAANRLVMEVDNVGQARRWLHNSLDMVELESDAKGPAGGTITRRSPAHAGTLQPVNAHGNVIDYAYDGAGRRTGRIWTLTATGEGNGTTSPTPDTSNPSNPDGMIVLATTWNGNSLPSTRTDDGGNTTTYEYDNLDRLIRVTADDGTQAVYDHDAEGNVSRIQDPNGNVIDRTYDAANRLIQASVTPAPGVIGSTLQSFQYDGLSRLTLAFDINDPGDSSDDVEIRYTYDSLGRIVEEQQSLGAAATGVTSFGWRAEDLRTDLVTPSSLHAVYGYDSADRLTSVAAAGRSTTYEYFGRSRVHTRRHGNGVRVTMLDDSGTLDIGFDEARRIQLLRYLDPNNGFLGGYDYEHDRAGNRISALRLHHTDPNGYVGEVATYDSAGRLISWQERILDAGHAPSGPVSAAQTWSLDGAGSWASHSVDGIALTNTPNNNNEYDEPQSGGVRVDDGIPDDFADTVAVPSPDGVNLAHDMNGSQVFDGAHTLAWDAFGRLVQAVEPVGGLTVSTYSYDPLGRRIGRSVANRGALDETRRYFYAGPGVVEEADGAGVTVRTSLAGIHGRDWLWQVTGGGSAQYYLQDAHGSTVGMADDAFPDVIERVTYTPYGRPEFTDPNNVPLTDPNGLPAPRSTVGNPSLFAGMRHDPEGGGCPAGGWGPECGGAYVTLRGYYSPFQGRFLSRDPLGVWADPRAAGNGYVYAGGNPLNLSHTAGSGPEDDRVLSGMVKSRVAFAGIGGISMRFAISELGPLGVFLSASLPMGILLEPCTGLSMNDFSAGVEFLKRKTSLTYKHGSVEAKLTEGRLLTVRPRSALKRARLAKLDVTEPPREIKVLFNPRELTVTKTVPWDEKRSPGQRRE